MHAERLQGFAYGAADDTGAGNHGYLAVQCAPEPPLPKMCFLIADLTHHVATDPIII